MHPTVNMYSSADLSSVNQRSAILGRQSELKEHLIEAKTLFLMRSSVRYGAELIAGVFVIFYLLAALALTGALLFYTFNR